MALQLNKTYKGFTCNYWKILTMTSDNINTHTIIRIGLYKDSTARQSSVDNFLEAQAYNMDGVDKTRSDAYTYLKTLDDFSGAQDV